MQTSQSAASVVLEATGIHKVYDEGVSQLHVLQDISLSVRAGEMVAIVGASGSGKSTLLQVLGLLDTPTQGTVSVAGVRTEGLSEARKSELRNRKLGFVYQFHHLLSEFTALDNVAMPLIVRRMARNEAREHAREKLAQVGLAARALHAPGQLSGGERQRVALARSLVGGPACVLADEPTGNLDRHTAQDMFSLLTHVNRSLGTAFIIVTHDLELAARADRRLVMADGRLVQEDEAAAHLAGH
ncbi:Lipoprotein releasing system ATP-binding protein LolD [plant metagenome]|uniref:Lipoprotein releasing system ATP-binding protein LolD n=1 Tax=plant metagenome TaxID=1297885 RepID=A0A484RMJ7_9ZZZZ